MSVLGVRDCVGGRPLDAIADAAQLLLYAYGEPMALDDWDWLARTEAAKATEAILRVPVRDVCWPEDIWRISPQSLAFIYTVAAREAFKACPALREEA